MADINDYLKNYQAVQSSLPATPPMPQGLTDTSNQLSAANQSLTSLSSGAGDFSKKLEQALLEHYDYNKDLITQRNQAQTSYLSAPAVAREKYADVFNPFTKEKLVSQYTAQALEPYSTYTDLLGERKANIADIVGQTNTGYQSNVQAARDLVNSLTGTYGRQWNEYQQGISNQQSQAKSVQDLLDQYYTGEKNTAEQEYKDRALKQALDIANTAEAGRTARSIIPSATEQKQKEDESFLQTTYQAIQNPIPTGYGTAEQAAKSMASKRPDLANQIIAAYKMVTGKDLPGYEKESVSVAAETNRNVQEALTKNSRQEAESFLNSKGVVVDDKISKLLDQTYGTPNIVSKGTQAIKDIWGGVTGTQGTKNNIKNDVKLDSNPLGI